MNNSSFKTIYFITGASGVGKTTLVEQLMKKYENKPWSFFHFDSIGIPPLPEMVSLYGSPAAWQKATTFKWIDKLVLEHQDEKIFVEGQTDLRYIHEGFAKHNFKDYYVVLVDCSEKEMEYRLTHNRAQPELFTVAMINWLQYLKRQAEESKTPIIISSNRSPEELVKAFEKATGL